MKTTKLLLTVACFFLLNVGFAQNNSSTNDEKQKIEARNAALSSKDKAIRPVGKDEYMGKQKEILAKLNVKEIPADFPKYKEGMAVEDYKKMMKLWMKNNKDLLNPEFKKKMEAKKGDR